MANHNCITVDIDCLQTNVKQKQQVCTNMPSGRIVHYNHNQDSNSATYQVRIKMECVTTLDQLHGHNKLYTTHK